MSDATEGYFVSRTLGVLELLAAGPRTASQVAEALQIHQRTARRMLNGIAHDGYATRVDGPRPMYSLTPRFGVLAGRALREQVRSKLAESEPAADQGECIILALTLPDRVTLAPTHTRSARA